MSLSSFESPVRHAAISELIRRRSVNRADVREVALAGLDLGDAKSVLDLGCGFGFMTEAIAPRVAADALIVGIDACEANEQPYLACVAASGRRGEFSCRRIESRLEWPDESFDLVLASYALYFFPEVVADIARVLARHGVFLAVTHTERSCRELLRAVGLPETNAPLLRTICGFSAESGAEQLSRWFDEVEHVRYENALVFDGDAPDDLLTFVRFKLPLLLPEITAGDELPETIAQAVHSYIEQDTPLRLDKEDAAFRCRRPRKR